MDRAFMNVIILSLGFMLVFTAFQTMGNIEVSDNKATYNYMFFFCYVRALPRISRVKKTRVSDQFE
jgi:hypothetical protein